MIEVEIKFQEFLYYDTIGPFQTYSCIAACLVDKNQGKGVIDPVGSASMDPFFQTIYQTLRVQQPLHHLINKILFL